MLRLEPRTSPQASILIVADEPATGNLWGVVLRELNCRAVVARTASQAMDMMEEVSPDLIVVDISLFKTNALEICSELFGNSAAPIMLLTPINNESHMLEAYHAGVDEVMIKPVSPALFLAKIKVMLRHSRNVSSENLENLKLGELTLEPSRRDVVQPNGIRIPLTHLEFRVLYMLMNHPDYAFQPGEIVRRIWGYDPEESSVLVKNVIYRLRKKLEPNPNQPRYIRTETGGYLFRP